MNTILVLEQANIVVDNADGSPGDTNHLAVQELKLPALEEQYVDHAAGGAPIATEVPTVIARPEATFNLVGFVPQVMKLIGLSNVASLHFRALGAVRDRQSGELMQVTAKMWGRLGRSNPTAFRRTDNMGHEFSIRAITHYELDLGGDQIYYWDFFTSVKRIGGVDQNGQLNAILGIGGGTSGTQSTPNTGGNA